MLFVSQRNIGCFFHLFQVVGNLRHAISAPFNPAYSSQECSACGHTEEGNRKSQSDFQCLKCKHTENADLNASKVIKRRGVLDLLAGKFVPLDESKIKVKARRTRVPVCGGDVRGKNQGSYPVPVKQKPNSENPSVQAGREAEALVFETREVSPWSARHSATRTAVCSGATFCLSDIME